MILDSGPEDLFVALGATQTKGGPQDRRISKTTLVTPREVQRQNGFSMIIAMFPRLPGHSCCGTHERYAKVYSMYRGWEQ